VSGADPRISPLLAPTLPAMPPALLVTAGFDILRDEGEAYAARLRETGTRVVAWREPTLGHGFINMTGLSAAARRAMLRIAREWRALTAAPPP
jgi:acetyl esterase